MRSRCYIVSILLLLFLLLSTHFIKNGRISQAPILHTKYFISVRWSAHLIDIRVVRCPNKWLFNLVIVEVAGPLL